MARGRRRKSSLSSESSSSSEDSDDSREGRSRKRYKSKRGRGDKRRRKGDNDSDASKRKGRRSDRKKDNEDRGLPSPSESEKSEKIVRYILKKFPDVNNDLKQMLQMIDEGQAVDLGGLSNSYLLKLLEKLFQSLNLKKHKNGTFFLSSKAGPTLEILGHLFDSIQGPEEPQVASEVPYTAQSIQSSLADPMCKPENDDQPEIETACPKPDSAKRVIGPHMPSAEELASAATQTQPQPLKRRIGPQMPSAEELKSATTQSHFCSMMSDLFDDDDDILIGPPPPTIVAEAESANEAERFEEVSRISTVSADNPYEMLGLNRNTTSEAIKKRYWKLSLLVHPDKCSHPQTHQAFVLLNQAFKELQDPEKRKAIDEKILQKEEFEEFKAELQAQREAAQWRKIRGEPLPGDDEFLNGTKLPPGRDEWMTKLPPERTAGLSMHSVKSFSKSEKEGRGDTGIWTDTPDEMSRKARMRNSVTYNTTATLGDGETAAPGKKHSSSDAELVDAYASSKRSKSLLQKHQEDAASGSRKKQKKETVKEDWVGQHPWKPWSRETDLAAGRQKVDLDPKSMAQGLTSRFSSGSFQRNFL